MSSPSLSFVPSPRILPWRNWREFEEVCFLVLAFAGRFNSGSASSSHGELFENLSRSDARIALIEKLAEWHSRSRCPNAITATYSLALLDWSSSKAILERETLSSLQLAAAATISRVINALSDSAQTGVFASSISELMKKAGVARWIVDIRHDCSHGAMPSVPVLKLAANYILDYVINEYWLPQSKLAAVPTLDVIPLNVNVSRGDSQQRLSINGGSRQKGDKTGSGVKRKRTEDLTRLYFREHSQSWRRALESINLSAGGGSGVASSGAVGTSPKSSPTSAGSSRLQNLLTAALRLIDLEHIEQLNSVDTEEDSTSLFPHPVQVIVDESAKNKVLSEGITRIVQITVMHYFEYISNGSDESVVLHLFLVRMFSIQAVSPDATLRALTFILNDEFKLDSNLKAHRTEIVKFLMSRHWASYFDAKLAKRSGFELLSTGEEMSTPSSLSNNTTDEDIHDIAQWPKAFRSHLEALAPVETLFGYIDSNCASKSNGANGKKTRRGSGGVSATVAEKGEADITENNQLMPRSSAVLFLDRSLILPLMMTSVKDEKLRSHFEKGGLLPLVDQERGICSERTKHPRWRK
jgi:hypothetical protein